MIKLVNISNYEHNTVDNKGVGWKTDFADDIYLLSQRYHEPDKKLDELEVKTNHVCLKVNPRKTKNATLYQVNKSRSSET